MAVEIEEWEQALLVEGRGEPDGPDDAGVREPRNPNPTPLAPLAAQEPGPHD